MSGGVYAWAFITVALVAVYLFNLRSSGLGASRLVKMAAIWVAIIAACYLIVSWVTGQS